MKKNIKFDRDKIKIIFTRKQSFVNKEKGFVTTVLDWKVLIPELLEALIYPVLPEDKRELVSLGEPIISGRATGTARLNTAAGDQWNETIGRQVSNARAEQNAYVNASKSLRKKMADVAFVLKTGTDMVLEFADKTYEVVQHNESYIKRIAEVE